MCGRYNLGELTWAEVRNLMLGIRPAKWDEAEAAAVAAITDRYNVAPTQQVPLVRITRREDGELVPAWARWGLVPRWWRKTLKEWRANTINARVETVAESPSFRDAYRNPTSRCVIPMAGYYEWSTLTGTKEAFYIQPSGNEGGLLALGLWSEVQLPDWSGQTVTMLTEAADGEVSKIHDRQPVFVDGEGAQRWLDGEPLESILRQPPERRRMHKVGAAVNNWRSQGPDLIRPAD